MRTHPRQKRQSMHGLSLVATPNSAHTAVIALDGDGPAIAPWRSKDTRAARTNTDPNPVPGTTIPTPGSDPRREDPQ